MPTAITINSPIAVVNQVNKKGISRAKWSMNATMNILNVKTSVLIHMSNSLFVITRPTAIVISNEITDCDTPNNSYTPSVDMKKFDNNTPMIIPQKYFLLKTIKWLNISDTRNWMFVNPKGAISAVTAI